MAVGKIGKSSRVFVWIILILIMVGLVGFGATGVSGTVRSIGQVGDTNIDLNRYARELDQELRALQAQTGQTMTLAQARSFGVDQAVLQRLVATAALENEATRIGLSVGDEEVRRQVLSTPAFTGIDGNFDRETYEFTLERSGLNPATFEENVRAEVSRNILQTAVGGGISGPRGFTDLLVGFIGERRNFSWIELDESALENPLSEPGDEDLRAHYDANIADFTLPEARKLTYAWLSPDFILDQVEINEDALRELFEDRSDEYNVPERRLVERLVFGTAEEAGTALADINEGLISFKDVVESRGLQLADIDLGDVTRAQLGDAGDKVFELTQPGLAGPLETSLGPALFRVNAILAAQSTSFEDARDTLRDEFAADSARRNIDDQIADFDDLLAGGATLEELADETDMQLGNLNWVGDLGEGIAAYEDFNIAAANVSADDFPEIIQLEDGGIFALRLDEIVPAHPEPFDDVVVRVIQSWERAEINQRLGEQAAVLQAQLANGARIGSLGLPSTVETQVLRNSFIEGTAPDFLATVFEMQAGESRVIRGADRVLIAQLSEILPPDLDDPDTETLSITVQQTVTQGISQDVLDAFTRAMETQGGISLDQHAINAVHAQFP